MLIAVDHHDYPSHSHLTIPDPRGKATRVSAIFSLCGLTFFDAKPPVQAYDILEDGFIARTFSTQPEDARLYFTSFFRTQDFLRDYGISYSRGAWRITENEHASFARWPLSRSPSHIQDSPQPPVDFDVTETQGTVVPQRRWTVAALVEYRRHVQPGDDVLQLPIFFVHQNGGVGFSLSDILQGHDGGLYDGDKEASLGGLTATFIRISVSFTHYYNELQT
jgi:hypothetical protein